MKKEYGYSTLEVIYQASAGNETVIKEILKFYGLISVNYVYVCFITLKVVKSLCRLMKN